MAYYTKEQINRAKNIDLLSYLMANEPDEIVQDTRNTYSTRTHDSLKINNGMWFWFSKGIGGVSALDYLVKVKEMKFTDAVERLINQKGLEKRYYQPKKLTEQEKIDRFILPKKAESTYKITAYLMYRGISKSIIEECINKGLIYQDLPNNNVVFVGYDEKDNPRYAMIRGTTKERFMYEAYGSDKTYSFKLNSIIKKNDVHLFESAIDLLSYATLKELNNEHYDEENLLSLAGIYNPGKDVLSSKTPKTLSNYLKNNSNIDTIYLHLDNDQAGRLATKAIQKSLLDSYKIIDNPPPYGKDFNEFLVYKVRNSKKKENEKVR